MDMTKVDSMQNEENASPPAEDQAKPLSPAAKRALAEAEARRKLYLAEEAARPKELAGRGGNDPNRYGDWEVKGLTSDF